MSLDGVIQSPGSPKEDQSGGFEYGGWIAPYDDEVSAKMMKRLLEPADLLLGRKTFDIWENYWPEHADYWPGINEVTKYVISKTRTASGWKKSVFLDSIEAVKDLKTGEGSDIKVWGSSELIQSLLQRDLVDEMWLMIHPLTIGKGKKLFTTGAIAAAFNVLESVVTPNGVIITHYQRAGEIKTGTVGAGNN